MLEEMPQEKEVPLGMPPGKKVLVLLVYALALGLFFYIFYHTFIKIGIIRY